MLQKALTDVLKWKIRNFQQRPKKKRGTKKWNDKVRTLNNLPIKAMRTLARVVKSTFSETKACSNVGTFT